MPTHPFVSGIRSRYRNFVASFSDHQIVIMIELDKTGRECIRVSFNCSGDEDDTINILCEVTNRYPINGVRHQKYLHKLAELLSVNNVGVQFKLPRTTQLHFALGISTFETFPGWEELAEAIDDFIGVCSEILITATLMAHLNFRLSGKGGTRAYQKLLPSRLAELTMCGLSSESLMN